MRSVAVSGLLFILAAGGAAAQETAPGAAPPSIELPPALDRVLRDYESAWRAKDAAALAALFTEDGFVLGNGTPPVRGRGAIRAKYEHSGGSLHLRAIAYAMEGPVGYIIGGYSHSKGEADSGKFTLTLRKAGDGRWLIVSDMDNSNQSRRPPGPTASP